MPFFGENEMMSLLADKDNRLSEILKYIIRRRIKKYIRKTILFYIVF